MKVIRYLPLALALLCLGHRPTLALAESPGSHLFGLDPDAVEWKHKTEEWWRSVLTPEQFRVCRMGGTERAFSGRYCHLKEHGEYRCALCGQLLFNSDTKFDSGTGWPSFSEAASEGVVTYHADTSHGMERTEVRCGRCGAHLGHVFEDGPRRPGNGSAAKRFCINSVCLEHRRKESP